MEVENRGTGKRKWKITDRPTDRPADRPTGWPTDRPTDRLTGRPTGRPADRPADRLADRPTDRPGLITENHTPYSELKMGNGNCSETESEKNPTPKNPKPETETRKPAPLVAASLTAGRLACAHSTRGGGGIGYRILARSEKILALVGGGVYSPGRQTPPPSLT